MSLPETTRPAVSPPREARAFPRWDQDQCGSGGAGNSASSMQNVSISPPFQDGPWPPGCAVLSVVVSVLFRLEGVLSDLAWGVHRIVS